MARIYVGNLPLDIRSKDIEDLFWKYGRIRDVDLKNLSRPPAFAFVSFERYEDAEDAIRGRGALSAWIVFWYLVAHIWYLVAHISLKSSTAHTIFGGTDGVMFEGQRLRVEMSKGSADVLGSGGAYGGLDRRDDRCAARARAFAVSLCLMCRDNRCAAPRAEASCALGQIASVSHVAMPNVLALGDACAHEQWAPYCAAEYSNGS